MSCFSALFCCNDHFKTVGKINTDEPCMEILYDHMLGNRYFVKFKCLTEEEKQRCSKYNDSLVMFTENVPGTTKISHCGVVLKEEEFNDSTDPMLTAKSKITCLSLACGDCHNVGCPGMAKCHQLPLIFLSIENMVNKIDDNSVGTVFDTLKANPKFANMPSFIDQISIDI